MILAALNQAEKYLAGSFAELTQLLANCPLRPLQYVTNVMNSFSQKNASSQISCFKFGWMILGGLEKWPLIDV